MTRILLTGAGFSRNWGGWLANEAFEYLLGCTELDEPTRRLLWRSKESGGGFEDTLADLQNARDEQTKKRCADLTAALVGMFNEMGLGFMRRQFEFRDPPEVTYMVKTFLAQFDAIFTLNQDTLLEQHYLDMMVGGRWNGNNMPGVRPLHPHSEAYPNPHARISPKQPDPDNFRLSPGIQPYIKLHGSCNWNAGTSGARILIMGGRKAISIDQFPLLSWYHGEFRSFLSRPGARLMVIGYSFSDRHINDAIAEGVERGLKLFIVDPMGVDVLDKRRSEPVGRGRDEYMDKLSPHIIGASRRPISSIFNDDVVEHARMMKFFA
jgi:SIR2-like protein